MDEIETRLADYITKVVMRKPNYALNKNQALITGGLIDSFYLVDLAMFVEETFGVHIDDAELNADTFDTLAQLAALVRARL